MGKIIWLIGVIAAIWCVLDIFKKSSLNLLWKIILCIAVLATSWIGFAVYYFWLRKKV